MNNYDQFVHAALEAESDEYKNIDYFKYLLRKEKITSLDDGERWELQNFISKYGYQAFVEDEA